MIANAALIVPAGLGHVRRTMKLSQRHISAQLGVRQETISEWENGHTIPATHHLIGYAALIYRSIMVGRDQIALWELADLLPDLGGFRRQHQLTQRQIGERMHLTSISVSRIECRAQAGKVVGWHSTVRYFDAYGYRLGIVETQMARAVTAA